MKKLALVAAIAAFSTTAFAGGSVGIGYQASTSANNYGDCFTECFGDGEPAGLAITGSYDINDKIYVTVDLSSLRDEEDFYATNDGYNSVTTQTRAALGAGYRFPLNADSTLTAGVNVAETNWKLHYLTNGNMNIYKANDALISAVGGVDTKVTNRVNTGASLSLGQETGIKAYMTVKLDSKLSLTTSYERLAYKLNADYVDGSTDYQDYQFNDENFRVSLNYGF